REGALATTAGGVTGRGGRQPPAPGSNDRGRRAAAQLGVPAVDCEQRRDLRRAGVAPARDAAVCRGVLSGGIAGTDRSVDPQRTGHGAWRRGPDDVARVSASIARTGT